LLNTAFAEFAYVVMCSEVDHEIISRDRVGIYPSEAVIHSLFTFLGIREISVFYLTIEIKDNKA